MVQKNRIGSLIGLKVIFLCLIYWGHSGIPLPVFANGKKVDFGMAGCVFFFLSAGFLLAYRYHDKWSDAKLQLGYLWKKLLKFWPLHLAAFLMCCWAMKPEILYTQKSLVTAIMNLGLVHAWSHNGQVRFSFNGVSWFLSALLFCYLMAPLIMKYTARRGWMVLLPALLTLRWFMEWVAVKYSGYYWVISFHSNPFIRLLEFSIGMCLFQVMEWLKTRFSCERSFKRVAFFTLIEALAGVFMVFWIVPNAFWQTRGLLPLWYGLFILAFSFDGGWFSRILASRFFVFASTIELEFFIFHQAIMKLCRADLIKSMPFVYAQCCLFAIVIVVSVLWHVSSAQINRWVRGEHGL